jgi:ubiquinone/menaquinone biosynthesis C-methylase UbiE
VIEGALPADAAANSQSLVLDSLLSGLRAAGEPTRLRLLALTARAELSVTELTQILGQSQPRVSRHLKLLCDAGLLERLREGTSAYYRIAQTGASAELARTLVSLIPPGDPALAGDLARLDGIRRSRAAAAADYFRANAARWDEIRSLYVPEREVEEAMKRLIGRGEIGHLLDVGTGTGRILEVFAQAAERATGIDLSREMLAVARSNLERANRANCGVRHADMYSLPFPESVMDAVVVHQVLHFAEDPGAAVAEGARVLAPGGRLVVVDFAPHEVERLRSDHAHRRLGFADAEVTGWCKVAGLEVAEIQHLPGDPLTVTLWAAGWPREVKD